MSYLARLKVLLAAELRLPRAPTLLTEARYVGNVGTPDRHIFGDVRDGSGSSPPQNAPTEPTDVTDGRALTAGHSDDSLGAEVLPDAVADAIQERMAIIDCPEPYRYAFARLNHQKPTVVSVEAWECAVNDAGLFFDAWGTIAVQLGWTAADLFAVPNADRHGGLIWRLHGERVEALGPDHARIGDERIFDLRS